ncbi:MAG: hypothetical protein WB239_11125 [Acidimicrobiia bacterium]
MIDPDRVKQLSRLLRAAGRAHHAEVGGPSPTWSQWYADFIHPDIAEHLGFEPSVEQVAAWLRAADEQHRAEAPDEFWPNYYARFILESVGA